MSKGSIIKKENQASISLVDAELENIASTAEREAGFDKTLRFKQGDYLIDEEKIPLGTEYLAHPEAWTKTWTKYVDGELVERKVYRVAKGEKPLEREKLDELELIGTKNEGGLSADCWVLRNLLPLEIRSSGEVIVFSSQSVGGKIAVADLAKTYARRVAKFGGGLPIIKLAKTDMPTRYNSKTPRPLFEIDRWEDREMPGGNVINLPPRDTIPPATSEADFQDDEIPDFGDDKISY